MGRPVWWWCSGGARVTLCW